MISEHSSHVQLIFGSPTLSSTVCNKRSININLTKWNRVLHIVPITGSHFLCHCISDLFPIYLFSIPTFLRWVKANWIPQQNFLQASRQLWLHICIWAEKINTKGRKKKKGSLIAFGYLWGQWHPTAFQPVWLCMIDYA